jgi:branched-chain amino acid transport system permease protein
VYTLVFHAPVLGGENGIPAISRVDLGPIELSRNRVYWYLLVACVAAGIAGYRVVIGSPFGHALQAIREDPRRAAFLGLDLRMYRVAAFTLAGFGAGLAGSLFAYASQIVTPDVMYWTQSGNPIIMALIGGMHSFYGPALGAVIFTYLLHELGHVTPAFNVYLGLVFLGFLIFLPGGAVSAPAVARTLLRRAFARVRRERKARP